MDLLVFNITNIIIFARHYISAEAFIILNPQRDPQGQAPNLCSCHYYKYSTTGLTQHGITGVPSLPIESRIHKAGTSVHLHGEKAVVLQIVIRSFQAPVSVIIAPRKPFSLASRVTQLIYSGV